MATQILLNPSADNNRVWRAWRRHQRAILRRLAPAEVALAEDSTQAEALVGEGALKGIQRFITVGGPELQHGLVNALMGLAAGHRESLQVGELALFGHGDLGRTLALPETLAGQLEMLSAGHTLPVDVGQVEWVDGQGAPRVTYFLGGAGFAPRGRLRREVTTMSARFRRLFDVENLTPGRLWRHIAPEIRLEEDGEILYEGPSTALLVMSGRYYQGLGEVAPRATPHDGALDVVWLPPEEGWRRAARLVRLLLPRLPSGRPFARGGEARSERLRVTSNDVRVSIEADGQPAGQLPAVFSVEPRTLHVIVPLVGVRLKKPAFKKLPQAENGELVGISRNRVGRHSATG